MIAVVAAFNQEKVLVGAFSVIVQPVVEPMDRFAALIRDDIADMAMSEQYLRTKQALLKAKKKEQEMQIAQKMASIREEEVIKMREKVAKMQVDKYLFLL